MLYYFLQTYLLYSLYLFYTKKTKTKIQNKTKNLRRTHIIFGYSIFYKMNMTITCIYLFVIRFWVSSISSPLTT